MLQANMTTFSMIDSGKLLVPHLAESVNSRKKILTGDYRQATERIKYECYKEGSSLNIRVKMLYSVCFKLNLPSSRIDICIV
jgi:hypothetical protein